MIYIFFCVSPQQQQQQQQQRQRELSGHTQIDEREQRETSLSLWQRDDS
jgi:hypothetical protein